MRIKALFLSEFKGKTVIIFPNRKQFMIENIQPEGAALGSIYTCDLLGVRYCVDFSIHAIAKKMDTQLILLLPPANEVAARSLHLSISHSVHRTGEGGLCMMSLPAWLPGPMFLVRGQLEGPPGQRPPSI